MLFIWVTFQTTKRHTRLVSFAILLRTLGKKDGAHLNLDSCVLSRGFKL